MARKRDNKGRFLPGQGGRPPGAKNRAPKDIADRILQMVDENLETFQADLQSLKPRDRVKYFLEMAKLILPSKSEVDAKLMPVSEIEMMTDEELDKYINQLETKK